MELMDLYRLDGTKTGLQAARSAVIPEGTYRLCAELWLLDSEGRLLLQQRSARRRLLPSVWTMTTGGVTAGEDSIDGVLREANEELGVSLRRDAVFYIRRLVHGSILWDIYASRLKEPATLTLQPQEVSAARWITERELRELMAAGDVFTYPEMPEVFEAVLALFQCSV